MEKGHNGHLALVAFMVESKLYDPINHDDFSVEIRRGHYWVLLRALLRNYFNRVVILRV